MRPYWWYLVGAAGVLLLALGALTADVAAHVDGCHRWHSCPSDLYTYRWHGLLCTSHSRDKIRVVYDGRTYWCHR